MAPEIKKYPLLVGQFVYVVTRKDGRTRMVIGPDPLEVTDDDIFGVPNKLDPTKMDLLDKEGGISPIQNFVTLRPNEYAVVLNPVSPSGDPSPNYPNGKWQTGKNDVKTLEYGRKQVITSGSFPVWPGQLVEVRIVPRLSAKQYLMIQVESPTIDQEAPYYDLVMKCASITKALVDETVASETDETALAVDNLPDDMGGEAAVARLNKEQSDRDESPEIKVGQRIIIPGNLAPTFIPPSGTDVVPVEVEVEAVASVILDPTAIISERISTGDLKMENLRAVLASVGLDGMHASIRDHYVDLRDSGRTSNALARSLNEYLDASEIRKLASYWQNTNPSKTKASGVDLVVREALVPGPTQFCVLIDENGDPETKKGPGRVWPGPNDTFRTEGSRGGIYDAYHIRTDRGLLLRIVATEITKAELTKQLPEGSHSQLEKDVFHKGEEILIGGFDAYFVPSKSVEVRNPITRQLHIGNDHSEVYVQAIGVDQKSGIYISKLETGNIALVTGEKKVLPDPRKERHMKRQIPGKMFNLMIASQEPHKAVKSDSIVESPWAISIIVPHNCAVLVTGKDSRRVVVGACRTLLEYEEVLEVLQLTKGRPKLSGNEKFETCFLRIDGNRITDQVELETSDFVKVVVDVAYSVEFVGKSQDEMIKWFNFQNYVLFLCDHLRSRLRGSARQLKFDDLYKDVSGFVRDTVLGKKPEGEGRHRPGMLFEQNNMRVKEVEILVTNITNPEVKKGFEAANLKAVTANLDSTARQIDLETKRSEEAMAVEINSIRQTALARELTAELTKINVALNREMEEALKENIIASKLQANREEQEILASRHAALLSTEDTAREAKEAEAALIRQKAIQEADIEFRQKLADIQKETLAAIAAGDVSRFTAIQPGLIEAIRGMGNSELAKALAENLPKAGGGLHGLLGVGGMEGLLNMVKGTPMFRALISEDFSDPGKRPVASDVTKE